mmetsp:Transcript_36498/g.53508  ORF Transcript_36498/g.53508 Transcript_36498/m.53508 type:complete len:653 (+) Transcript_36498:90-2048(+)
MTNIRTKKTVQNKPLLLLRCMLVLGNIHSVFPSKDENDKCRIYVAQSSMDPSKLGMYSGVDLPKDSPIGAADIGIPLIDIWQTLDQDIAIPAFDSFWTMDEILAQFEDSGSSAGVITGIGVAGSHHAGIVNVDWNRFNILDRYRTESNNEASNVGSLDRNKDAGAGAISEFFGVNARSSRPIAAGTEFFPDFGKDWAEAQEEDAEETGAITRAQYEKADQILTDFKALTSRFSDFFDDETKQETWDILIQDVVSDRNIKELLPRTFDEAERVADIGTGIEHNPEVIRSLEWLEENGQCMDNLVFGPSSIPAAGRGAFATRVIPEGSLVAPGPLLAFETGHFQLSPFEDGDKAEESKGKNSKQLFLNYCYGHPDSSLLLFPFSLVTNFINHSSKEPNAEIRWSTSSMHDESLLDLSIQQLQEKSPVGAMFDFVATRTIQPGEEIFIDYGTEWEEAWNKHVSEWKPPVGDEEYVSAARLNSQNLPFRTLEEQKVDPYPENVSTLCSFKPPKDKTKEEEEDDKTKEGNEPTYDMDISSEHLAEGATLHSWEGHTKTRKCNIIKRETDDNDQSVYFVRIEPKENSTKETKIYMKNVPQSAILFYDIPYSSDIHLVNVFRHPIGIPDSMFPEAWKNYLLLDQNDEEQVKKKEEHEEE